MIITYDIYVVITISGFILLQVGYLFTRVYEEEKKQKTDHS
jgi:hypothetical protein